MVQVCLEFWLQLTQDLYRDDPFCKPGSTNYSFMQNLAVAESSRKVFYKLVHLRLRLIFKYLGSTSPIYAPSSSKEWPSRKKFW